MRIWFHTAESWLAWTVANCTCRTSPSSRTFATLSTSCTTAWVSLRVLYTGVDKRGRGPSPPMDGQKEFYSKNGLSSFTWSAPGLPPAKSGRACYDNPTGRGTSITCPTCILVSGRLRHIKDGANAPWKNRGGGSFCRNVGGKVRKLFMHFPLSFCNK